MARQRPGFRVSNRAIIMIIRTNIFDAITGKFACYHDKKPQLIGKYLYYILHISIWQGAVGIRRYFPREISSY